MMPSIESHDELAFDRVPTVLVAQFPTLRASFDSLLARYGDDYDQPTFVYAAVYEVLGRYLDSLLIDGDEDTELRRVMDCIERLASHPAPDGRGLGATEIAYPLLGSGREELLERARLFMGRNTQEILRGQERLVAGARIGFAQRLTRAILGWRKVRVVHRRKHRDQTR